MSVIDRKTYRRLLAETLPHVVHTVDEHHRYLAELEELHGRDQLNPEEAQLAELLTLLVENFEERHYRIEPAATPADIVRELMASNGLKQPDMLDIFGTRSVASEVLSGKRDLSKSHIQKLSRRFNVSPEVFFPTRVQIRF